MSRKKMRNPMERATSYENPAGNVMQELSEIDLDKVTGGIDYVSNEKSSSETLVICNSCKAFLNCMESQCS